jgi:hypothetical protein
MLAKHRGPKMLFLNADVLFARLTLVRIHFLRVAINSLQNARLSATE